MSSLEVVEMRQRFAEGQSRNYIANAMGRSWTSVNRYVYDLSWVETRNPRRSPEEHLNYSRILQRVATRRQRARKETDECLYFLGPWL